MLEEVQSHLSVPVMPKLNIGLPAAYAVHLLKEAGIRFVSLLDSIKVPPPMRLAGGCVTPEPGFEGDGLSLFGHFMFPLTRQYTWTMAREGFDVCAGGGVDRSEDAADLLALGASCVQIATAPLLRGFGEFRAMNEGVASAFPEAGAENRVGPPREPSAGSGGGALGNRVPRLDTGKCVLCGRCTKQAFCRRIKITRGRVVFSGCEGCGLCAYLCPTGSISFI
jgi:Pyruvate/2-oxoacid:ferredoxin oxidoreductase delta subunit